MDLSLAFATRPSASLISLTQRILGDIPWTGIGAGNFAAITPIYRDIDDAPTTVAPTAAAAIAIELGRPMLWGIMVAITAGAMMLVRGAMRRGRDLFILPPGLAV